MKESLIDTQRKVRGLQSQIEALNKRIDLIMNFMPPEVREMVLAGKTHEDVQSEIKAGLEKSFEDGKIVPLDQAMKDIMENNSSDNGISEIPEGKDLESEGKFTEEKETEITGGSESNEGDGLIVKKTKKKK